MRAKSYAALRKLAPTDAPLLQELDLRVSELTATLALEAEKQRQEMEAARVKAELEARLAAEAKALATQEATIAERKAQLLQALSS
jgi:hypothetical protein